MFKNKLKKLFKGDFMSKNKKILYLGLVIVLLGIWCMIPSVSSSSGNIAVMAMGIFAVYGTPIGFILMLVGIFKKEN